jgi:PIN domain nuclease of toxin-antitoxin system
MKLLLDTHTLIWWDSDDARLGRRARTAIADRSNAVLVSVVSAWEIQIKHQLGRLDLARPLAEIIDRQRTENDMAVLPVTLSHVFALGDLPPHHGDPFDRLLLAQAQTEGAALVSTDAALAAYDVRTLW